MVSRVPLPMTQRSFFQTEFLPQIKAKVELIQKTYFKEIQLAEKLTYVPGGLIGAVIFCESAGNPSIVSPSGAIGLMQLKPQSANDVIHMENKAGRLTNEEITLLRKYLGKRLDGPLKQKFLSQRIPQNNHSGNVITKADLLKPELNILLGSLLLGILIDQHNERGEIRLDKVILRYNRGYFFKPFNGTIEQTLDAAKSKSSEAYWYALKVIGKNGLLAIQA